MVKVAWMSCPSFHLPAIEARWYRLYWSRLLNNSCSMSWLRYRYWSRSFWVDGLIKWIVERISLINWTVWLVSRVIYFYYSIYYYHYSTQLKVSAHKYVYFWQQLCWNKELKHVTTVVNLCILCWIFSNQDLYICIVNIIVYTDVRFEIFF